MLKKYRKKGIMSSFWDVIKCVELAAVRTVVTKAPVQERSCRDWPGTVKEIDIRRQTPAILQAYSIWWHSMKRTILSFYDFLKFFDREVH
jgi:hypothetical protein